MGDFPDSLALVDTSDSITVDTGAPLSAPADQASVDETEMESPDGSEFGVTFGNDADSDSPACAAVEDLVSGSASSPADISASFDQLSIEFPSPLLESLESALLGDSSAAADLFLDQGRVVDHLRLDARTYTACGLPVFAGSIGEAASSAQATGDCFAGTPLSISDKAAVGAELNEDLFDYVRVSCDS